MTADLSHIADDYCERAGAVCHCVRELTLAAGYSEADAEAAVAEVRRRLALEIADALSQSEEWTRASNGAIH